jgi:DNA polymerase (family 10)
MHIAKYSDGANKFFKRFSNHIAKQQGFEYLVISDHSKSAFYADGLSQVEKVLKQHERN